MACGFDKGLVAAHYDGETTAEERAEVERHLATCPKCARDLASMKELSAALKPLARASAPMSIAEGVIREIGSTRSARRPWIGWGLSAAAALFLAIGTVFMLDRGGAPGGTETFATAPKPALNSERSRLSGDDKTPREEAAKSLERRMEPKAAAEPPPATPPPAAPAPEADAPAKKMEGVEEARKAAPKDEKPAVPVVRVTAADLAAARGEVEAFLKERELKMTPGAPLLGRSAFVRDHYLQLDLTDAEVHLLEKRLAALKETVVARGSFDDEKKRVAEDLAKQKAEGLALGADTKRDEDHAEKDTETFELKEKADRARGAPALGGAAKRGPLRKIIFVFEPAPAKK